MNSGYHTDPGLPTNRLVESPPVTKSLLIGPKGLDRLVPDGSSVYLGGSAVDRKPVALVLQLIEQGKRDLDLIAFTGSIDVDLLVGAGCVRSVAAAYVGIGPHGRAPRFTAAVVGGTIEDLEYSEWSLLGRLRAASMGIPFLPTRAGEGSETVGNLGFASVRDPYEGVDYLALPPLHPDVALLHAWRASETGTVQLPAPRQHLWDVDILAAHAARTVVVSVEEIVPEATVRSEPDLTVLHSFEIDAVLPFPKGSWPTSAPPSIEADHEALARYVLTGGDTATLTGSAVV